MNMIITAIRYIKKLGIMPFLHLLTALLLKTVHILMKLYMIEKQIRRKINTKQISFKFTSIYIKNIFKTKCKLYSRV